MNVWERNFGQKCNEIQAFKFQINQRIYAAGFRMHGGKVCLTRKHVDLPLSIQAFRQYFMRFFPECSERNLHGKRIKTAVPSRELEAVFGIKWNVVKFENSSTQIKVIGDVVLLFREKKPGIVMSRR